MKIDMPSNVRYIIDKLNYYGYKAYIVGGCVRDSLLNRTPKDWDITTNAKPNDIMSLFDKTIPTGLQHGTVTVMLDGEGYEITTFRTESAYEDKRHPKEVKFVDSLIDDLSRRDFTINSMAYNDKEGLIDPFGGRNDLINKIVRCVGNPNERINEDALRMMRAVRFASQLNFEIESETVWAIINNSDNLKYVSVERIRSEFDKILLSNSPSLYITELISTGLSNPIIKILNSMINFNQNNPYHSLGLLEHTLKSVNMVDNKLHLRLTMLLHDIGKLYTKSEDKNGISHYYGHPSVSSNVSEEILKNMKYDNNTIKKVLKLIEYHDCTLNSKKSIKKMLNKLGEDLLRDLIKVKRADIMSQNKKYLNIRLNQLVKIEENLNSIINEKECFSTKNLDISGNDLINIGFKQGKEIGIMLNILLEKVIDNKKLNKKDQLLKIAIDFLNREV